MRREKASTNTNLLGNDLGLGVERALKVRRVELGEADTGLDRVHGIVLVDAARGVVGHVNATAPARVRETHGAKHVHPARWPAEVRLEVRQSLSCAHNRDVQDGVLLVILAPINIGTTGLHERARASTRARTIANGISVRERE